MTSVVSGSYAGNSNAKKNVTKEQMSKGVAVGDTVPPLVEQSVVQGMQSNPTDFTQVQSPGVWGGDNVQQQPVQVPLNVFSGGNVVQGRFENVPATGDISARQQQLVSGYSPEQGYAQRAPQSQTNFEGIQPVMPNYGWTPSGQPIADRQMYNATNNPLAVVGQHSLLGDPTQMRPNDLSSLQAALQGSGNDNIVNYRKDATKRDGGFAKWIRDNFGGRRPDEDAYDYRQTQNKKRLSVLADAIRHFGNIYTTTRYAPSQQFNSPTEAIEKDYQTRRALRLAKAKQDADTLYKQYKLQQDADKNALDANYKNGMLGLKGAAEQRAAARDKDLADYRQKQLDQQEKQAKRNYDLAVKKAKTDADYKAAQIKLGKDRNAIARKRAEIAASRAGGAGGMKNPYVINARGGKLLRGHNLTSVDRQGAVQKMKALRMLAPESQRGSFLNRLGAALTQEEKNSIIDGAIADFAMRNDAKSKQFQKYLVNNLGYQYVSSDTPIWGGDAYDDISDLFDE